MLISPPALGVGNSCRGEKSRHSRRVDLAAASCRLAAVVEGRGDRSIGKSAGAERVNGGDERAFRFVLNDAAADKLLSDRGEARDPSPLRLE